MRRWLPLLFLAAVGIALGTLRSRAWEAVLAHDKLLHATGFMLFAWALRHARPRWPVAQLAASAVAAAIVLELVQSRVPGRTASMDDVFAGTFGVLLALAAMACQRLLRARFMEADLPRE